MHAKKLLHNFLQNHAPTIHQYRFDSLLACCESLLIGQRLTVTDIGRSITTRTSAKHNIKRADRLLSNRYLHNEIFSFYQAIADTLVAAANAPIILIDWSDLTPSRSHFLLRASLALNGRPITLYEEVHTQPDGRQTHERFLRQLKRLLPEHSTPIIVTDAGFRGSWFIAVNAMGWDWVGRIRGKILCIQESDNQWISCRTLMSQATHTIKDLRHMRVIRQQNISCRLCLVKNPPKGRRQKNLDGSRSARKKSRENADSATEPWLIATTLKKHAAKTVIRYYALRMQIEESFRDIKNPRYGLSLRFTGTTETGRLSVLMLIAHIVGIMLYAIGMVAESKQLHRRMQSNSIKKRRVLSLPYLACLLIRTRRYHVFKSCEIHSAIQSIAARISAQYFL